MDVLSNQMDKIRNEIMQLLKEALFIKVIWFHQKQLKVEGIRPVVIAKVSCFKSQVDLEMNRAELENNVIQTTSNFEGNKAQYVVIIVDDASTCEICTNTI